MNGVVILMFVMLWGIADIVLAVISCDCDNLDNMKLYIRDYLIGRGVCNLFYVFVIMMAMISLYLRDDDSLDLIQNLMRLCEVFHVIWFIIGGIIMFRSNIDCINDHSSRALLALILWCLTPFIRYEAYITVSIKRVADPVNNPVSKV